MSNILELHIILFLIFHFKTVRPITKKLPIHNIVWQQLEIMKYFKRQDCVKKMRYLYGGKIEKLAISWTRFILMHNILRINNEILCFFSKPLYFCKHKSNKFDIFCYIFFSFLLKFKTFSLLALNLLNYQILIKWV